MRCACARRGGAIRCNIPPLRDANRPEAYMSITLAVLAALLVVAAVGGAEWLSSSRSYQN